MAEPTSPVVEEFTAANLSEQDFDNLTAKFKASMERKVEDEHTIQERYGFYVRAYSDHAVARGLKVNDRPVIIAARTSITGGMELAECVGVVAAKINQDQAFQESYDLPFKVNGKSGEALLRCKLVSVTTEQFNLYGDAAAMIPLAQEDEDAYFLLIGDDNNALPGEEGYNDIGQYREMPQIEKVEDARQ